MTGAALSSLAPVRTFRVLLTDGTVVDVVGREVAELAGRVVIYSGLVRGDEPEVAASFRSSDVRAWGAVT